MRVLVTGGLGYIGQVLIQHLLEQGWKVIIVDNCFHGQKTTHNLLSNPNIEYYHADARDKIGIKNVTSTCDTLVLLHALVGAPLCERNVELAREVNTDSIKMICQLSSPNQFIVFPNTNSGYGTTPKGVTCTEDTPLNAISIYGQTKNEAETIVRERGNSIVFRLATVFGFSPRMRLDLMVNDLAYQAYFNRRLEIFLPNARRNFISVQDVSRAFVFAIKNPQLRDSVFNLGLDSANMTKIQLANYIDHFLRNSYNIEVDVTVGNGTDSDQRDYVVSNQALHSAGFHAEFSLESGLHDLVKFFQTLPYNRKEREAAVRNMRNH